MPVLLSSHLGLRPGFLVLVILTVGSSSADPSTRRLGLFSFTPTPPTPPPIVRFPTTPTPPPIVRFPTFPAIEWIMHRGRQCPVTDRGDTYTTLTEAKQRCLELGSTSCSGISTDDCTSSGSGKYFMCKAGRAFYDSGMTKCVFTMEWEKSSNQHCPDNKHPQTFNTLVSAQAACTELGTACTGVYDSNCDGHGPFFACKQGGAKAHWAKTTGKGCKENHLESYTSLESAQLACLNLGNDCAGVQDSSCDDIGTFYTCKPGDFATFSSSCVYTTEGPSCVYNSPPSLWTASCSGGTFSHSGTTPYEGLWRFSARPRPSCGDTSVCSRCSSGSSCSAGSGGVLASSNATASKCSVCRAGQFSRGFQESGSCPVLITVKSDCENAAREFGFVPEKTSGAPSGTVTTGSINADSGGATLGPSTPSFGGMIGRGSATALLDEPSGCYIEDGTAKIGNPIFGKECNTKQKCVCSPPLAAFPESTADWGATCNACPSGKFQSQREQSFCSSCPAFQSTSTAGAVTGLDCIGASANTVNATTCADLVARIRSQSKPTTYHLTAGTFTCPDIGADSPAPLFDNLKVLEVGPGTVVSIVGAGGTDADPYPTVIDLDEIGSLFWITGGSVELSKMKIMNAKNGAIGLTAGHFAASEVLFENNLGGTDTHQVSPNDKFRAPGLTLKASFAGVLTQIQLPHFLSYSSATFTGCAFKKNARVFLSEKGDANVFFRDTKEFSENYPDLFLVKNGGTLVLEGGKFPTTDVAQLKFGAVHSRCNLVLRDTSISSSDVLLEDSSTVSEGACPDYTDKELLWRVPITEDGPEWRITESVCNSRECTRDKYGGVRCSGCKYPTTMVLTPAEDAIVPPYLGWGCSCAAGRAGAECAPCAPGRFFAYSKTTVVAGCSSCALGQFQDESAQNSCKACALGRWSNTTAASEAAACVACAVGRFGNSSIAQASAAHCEPCPSGKYQTHSGAANCATVRTLCGLGSFQSIDATTTSDRECRSCDGADEYSERENAVACLTCGAGFFRASSTSCIQCPPGFKCTDGRNVTKAECDGTTQYQDQAGQAACKNHPICAGSTYASSAGSTTAARICTAWRDCAAGSRVTNTPSPLEDRKCTLCDAGQSAPSLNSETCTACLAGTYQESAGKAFCQVCASGRIGGPESVVSAAHCVACAAGQYQSGEGETACTDCPAGSYSASGAPSCTVCASSKFNNLKGESSCKDCEGCGGDRRRKSCGGASEGYCGICSPGTFVKGSSCEDCTAGQYSEKENADKCKVCPTGKHKNTTKAFFCDACEPGRFGKGDVDQSADAYCQLCAAGRVQKASGVNAPCVKCAAGQYQAEMGQMSCLAVTTCRKGTHETASNTTSSDRKCGNCAPGKFSATDGAMSCGSCGEAQYQEQAGQSTCLAHSVCAAGRHVTQAPNTTQDRTCDDCSKMHFSNTSNAASCERCASGKYQNFVGQPYCETKQPCVPGTFEANTTDASSERCHQCAAGRISHVSNAPSCDACAAGTFQSEVGQATCTKHTTCPQGDLVVTPPSATSDRTCAPCPVFHFSNVSDAPKCDRCPAGKFQNAKGQPFCETYSEGFAYSVPDTQTGLVELRQCPPGFRCSGGGEPERCEYKISNPATGKCVSCEDKHFANTNTNECVACPLRVNETGHSKLTSFGVECTNGEVLVQDGYFVVGSHEGAVPLGPDLRVLRCVDAGVCESNVTANFSAQTTCKGNTVGLLCGVCEPGYGAVTGKCIKCPSDTILLLMAVAVALSAIAIALFVTKKSLEPDFETATLSIIRIFVSYLLMTGLLSQFQLDWGSSLRYLFNFAQAASGGMPPLLKCFGASFSAEIYGALSLPFVAFAAPALGVGVWSVAQWPRHEPATTIFGAAPARVYSSAVLALSFLLWPTVVRQALRVLDCSVDAGNGATFVASDLRQQCGTPEHKRLTAYALFTLCTVVPFVPIASALFLRRNKGRHSEASFKGQFYFLYGGFDEAHYYWESVVMLRKFLVIAVQVFLGADEHGYQVQAGLFVFTCAFTLQALAMPYYNTKERYLELLSLGATMLSMFCGQAIALRGLSEGTLASVRFFVAVLNIGVMAVFAIVFADEVKSVAALKKAQTRKGTAAQVEKPGGRHLKVMAHHASSNPMQRGSAVADEQAAAGELGYGSHAASNFEVDNPIYGPQDQKAALPGRQPALPKSMSMNDAASAKVSL